MPEPKTGFLLTPGRASDLEGADALLPDLKAQTLLADQAYRGDQDEAIGRSKGGLSAKIHATTDALGNPTGLLLTPGQASDLEGADALSSDLKARALLADKAYDADERALDPLRQAGKTAVIPPKRNRVVQRSHDRELCKERHLIESFFCKLKQYRAIASRHDKTARHFLAAIYLASTVIWLN